MTLAKLLPLTVIASASSVPSISASPLTSKDPASNSPVKVIFLKLAISLLESTTIVFDATTVPADAPSLKFNSVAVEVISVPPISRVVAESSPATVTTPEERVIRSVSPVSAIWPPSTSRSPAIFVVDDAGVALPSIVMYVSL